MDTKLAISRVGDEYIIVFLSEDDLRFKDYAGIVYFKNPLYSGFYQHDGHIKLITNKKEIHYLTPDDLRLEKICIPSTLKEIIAECQTKSEINVLEEIKQVYTNNYDICYDSLSLAIITEIDKRIIKIKNDTNK